MSLVRQYSTILKGNNTQKENNEGGNQLGDTGMTYDL